MLQTMLMRRKQVGVASVVVSPWFEMVNNEYQETILQETPPNIINSFLIPLNSNRSGTLSRFQRKIWVYFTFILCLECNGDDTKMAICKNGGTCFKLNFGHGKTGFGCHCPSGFSGPRCVNRNVWIPDSNFLWLISMCINCLSHEKSF